jgi:hypothetical protein
LKLLCSLEKLFRNGIALPSLSSLQELIELKRAEEKKQRRREARAAFKKWVDEVETREFPPRFFNEQPWIDPDIPLLHPE